MENSAADQQIILYRSMMNQKRSLRTVTPTLRSGQVINKIYNAELPIMKVLTMMKA